jgi:hypothetical protein
MTCKNSKPRLPARNTGDGASKLITEAVTHCSGYLLAPCGFSEWTTGPELFFESN